MDTCQFSYISREDSQPKYVLGIERSWDELKIEFNRTGPGCQAGAIYFKTISVRGPQLFAIVDDNTVFYHENGQWHRYITATDIKFGMLYLNDLNPVRAKTEGDYLNGDEWVVIPRDKEISFDHY